MRKHVKGTVISRLFRIFVTTVIVTTVTKSFTTVQAEDFLLQWGHAEKRSPQV